MQTRYNLFILLSLAFSLTLEFALSFFKRNVAAKPANAKYYSRTDISQYSTYTLCDCVK